eukprot:GSMAST32.ASY1.ANO1.117.1 assembled CDS
MGRRRKAKKPKKRPKLVVASVFKCPHCNHEKSVECRMDQSTSIGELACRICGSTYQARINYLSEPVDVYSEWLDELELAKEQDEESEEDTVTVPGTGALSDGRAVPSTGGIFSDSDDSDSDSD